MTQEKKNYMLPIIMMILLFGMISFVTNLAAPMGVVVKGQFQASNFMGMLGNFGNFIAYAFMGIPAGMMLKKIGYKNTALIAIVVGFIGVLVQFLSGIAESFVVYLIGAFISGFSMCMLNSVVNPMLNTLGGGGKKGNQLIQIGGTFNSLMATLVPVLVGILVGEVTKYTAITNINPVLFIAMGIFAVVGIVLFFVQIPEPNIQKAATQKKYAHSPWAFRHFVLGTVAIFVYVGIEVGVPGTLNLFFTTPTVEKATAITVEYQKQQADAQLLEKLKIEDKENATTQGYIPQVVSAEDFEKAEKVINKEVEPGLGISAAIAGTIVGLYWLLMLVGRFVGASLGAKVSSKMMLIVASGLGLILVLGAIFLPTDIQVNMPVFKSDISFGMAEVPINAMLLVLVGLCTSIMWGGIFNLAVEGLGKYTEAATGIFMVMVCGGGILPLIQNYVADVSGFMSSYWVIIAALAFLLYYALIGCKNVNKNIPVE